MQKFLKFRKDNSLSGFIGDLDAFNTLATVIENCGCLCVHGPVGVGKTHLVSLALKNHHYIEISKMSDIGDQISESNAHIVIDSYTIDKSILDHKSKISRGATIFITNTPDKIGFCEHLKVKPLTVSQMVEVGMRECPKDDKMRLSAIAMDSNGDMRVFMMNLKFPGTRDIFMSSRDWVHSMMCSEGTRDPLHEIGIQHPDHGFSADIIHSNIHMAMKNVNPRIFNLISEGDLYDSDQRWELINYFWLSSVYYPLKLIDRRVPSAAMNPGSAWTKFSNHRMRAKKLKGLPDRDTLMLLHSLDDPERLASYGITALQYDTINNISLSKNKKSKVTREALKALDPRPVSWKNLSSV